MSQNSFPSGVAPHAWLQHHLPWLAFFALVMGLFSEGADRQADTDELNG